MKAMIYAIGGTWTCDHLVGCAYDANTALSLIELVESKGGYAVSVHGDINGKQISGEMSLKSAKMMFHVQKENQEMV